MEIVGVVRASMGYTRRLDPHGRLRYRGRAENDGATFLHSFHDIGSVLIGLAFPLNETDTAAMTCG